MACRFTGISASGRRLWSADTSELSLHASGVAISIHDYFAALFARYRRVASVGAFMHFILRSYRCRFQCHFGSATEADAFFIAASARRTAPAGQRRRAGLRLISSRPGLLLPVGLASSSRLSIPLQRHACKILP